MRSWDRRVRPLEDEAQGMEFEPFDWMSENFQLMCREYRQFLGKVDEQTYESKYRTESEVRYWEELHRARGDKWDRTERVNRAWVEIEIISDPPVEWAIQWLQKKEAKFRERDYEESADDYGQRLEAFSRRINFGR